METVLAVVLGVGLGALLGVGTAAGLAESAYRRGWRDAEQKLMGMVIRGQVIEDDVRGSDVARSVVPPPGETITLN